MNIDSVIQTWVEKHASVLAEYSKGNANNEVMKMYRSQMKDIVDWIDCLKELKNSQSEVKLPNEKSITILGVKSILNAYQVECQLKYITGTVPDAEEWFKKTYPNM